MKPQQLNFGEYIKLLTERDPEESVHTSITMKSFLLFWYFSRVVALYFFNKIDIYITCIFLVVIFSMATNIYFWSKKNSKRWFFYLFNFLETVLIVYGAIFLDEFFLLLILAGSNTMTIILHNKKYTLYSATISIFFYMFFCIYKQIVFLDFFFNIVILIGYFSVNYVVAKLNTENIAQTKKTTLKSVFDKLGRGFFFHNSFTTFGNYSFESEVVQSEEFGGDFICLSFREEGEILGLVGDISSHGNDVFPGAVVLSMVFKSIAEIKAITPKEVLQILNNTLVPIEENHGGCGVFFCFRLLPDGTMLHSGGLFDGSLKINGKNAMLGKISILGHNEGVSFKDLTLKLQSSDKVTIITDGWTYYNKMDDKSKLKINFFEKKT